MAMQSNRLGRDDNLSLLRRCQLFATFQPDQLRRLEGAVRRISLASGESLFHQGEPAERFFMLLQGRVKLFRLSAEGHEKVIEIIQPGGTFAEAVMFMAQRHYPVNADTVGTCNLLSIDNKAYLALLRESQETCFNLLAGMSRKLHQHVMEIDRLTLQNATFRLAAYLLQLLPAGAGGEQEVNLPVPKRVIASRLSVQPETLSRLLQRFTRNGMITVAEQSITIHDVGGLRNLVTLESEEL